MSYFPGGGWVLSQGKKCFVTPDTSLDETARFVSETGATADTERKAHKCTWPASMFQPVDEILSESGDKLFTDRGNKLTFDREVVSDDAIRVSLIHAQQKFGDQLTLTGDDPIFTARMVRLADELGIKYKIENSPAS